jgi:hypothetical protein
MQEVKDQIQRSQHSFELRKCGAKEIRTPDLLHAMQARTVAGCGQMSLCMPFTCGDSGWTWPYVAWCLASLAPNLAPTNSLASLMFDSSNTLPGSERKAGPGGDQPITA